MDTTIAAVDTMTGNMQLQCKPGHVMKNNDWFQVEPILRDCVVRHPSISPGYWLPPEEHHKVRRAWVWNFELCFRTQKAMKANVEWFSQMNRKWGIKRNSPSTEQFDTQNRCFEVSRASTRYIKKTHSRPGILQYQKNWERLKYPSVFFWKLPPFRGGKDCCLQLTGVVQYGLFLRNGPTPRKRPNRGIPHVKKSRVVRWVQSMFHWWMPEAQP